MIVGGIDFETNSAEAKSTNATEVGLVLYEKEPGKRLVEVDRYSTLIYDPSYPPQTPMIVELTGISDEDLKANGVPSLEAFQKISSMVARADVMIAHKIAFDKTVLESSCSRLGIPVPKKEWICSLTNFPWNKNYSCKKLSHLAFEHGIMVDPRTLHRADADVDLMMRLIFECYDFQKVLEYARTPWIYAKADVIGPWKDGGKQTGEAKLLGFSFECVKGTDYPKWPKAWVTRVKGEEAFQNLIENARKSESPFRVSKIEGLST